LGRWRSEDQGGTIFGSINKLLEQDLTGGNRGNRVTRNDLLSSAITFNKKSR
jgi:hypothetical protein